MQVHLLPHHYKHWRVKYCQFSQYHLQLIAFLQSFTSNLINVGIKHVPLGQSEGQKILINLLPVIEKQANINKIAQINNLGSSAFLSDLSSMYHETLNNRIYQT